MKTFHLTPDFLKAYGPLYVSPTVIRYCDKVALLKVKRFDEVQMTEDILNIFPHREYYIEIRSDAELKEACDNLKVQLKEFMLE